MIHPINSLQIMIENKFKLLLEILLKKDKRLIDENGELNLPIIRNFVDKLDEKLIELLMSNDEIQSKFFVKVKSVLVFKQNDFKFLLDSKKIENSYTSYENRIGLGGNGKFLNDYSDIVINFPYKDCVLEGGQSTEDGFDEYYEYDNETQNYEIWESDKKEVFFNEILAQNEIDRLFEPKAFTNIKKFSNNKIEPIKTFTKDDNGLITDNLIIKGNNLLALHSLNTVFNQKIKLIYIDPPYNTSGAANTFVYNNSFNHSTWLTFMKNRIEISKNLLTNDGFLAVSIDHAEFFYLGVLLDEIFKRENRVGIIAVETNPRGRSDSKFFATSHEYLLVYAKDINIAKIENLPLTEDQEGDFDLVDNISKYRLLPFRRSGSNSSPNERPKLRYPIYYNEKTKYIGLIKKENCVKLEPDDKEGNERVWRQKPKTFEEANERGDIIIKKKTSGSYSVFLKDRIKNGRKPKTFWSNPLYDASSHGTILLKSMFGEKIFSYPKSIHLVKDVFRILTKPGDIICDFFAGSGTTAQAVLELNVVDEINRKFILVEQMNYVEDVTVKRVHKVIKNLKDGNFVFMEIKKWNEKAKEKISQTNSLAELKKLLNELNEKYFLDYNVKFKEFKDELINEVNFKELTLKKQQEIIAKMLDLNQLYVNAAEMEDINYNLEKSEVNLTKDFYKLKNE